MGKLYVVGFGPGGYEHMTAKCIDVIIFIKNSFELNENREKMSAFDKAERVLMRNKQRLKILEDIKKRLKIIS